MPRDFSISRRISSVQGSAPKIPAFKWFSSGKVGHSSIADNDGRATGDAAKMLSVLGNNYRLSAVFPYAPVLINSNYKIHSIPPVQIATGIVSVNSEYLYPSTLKLSRVKA